MSGEIAIMKSKSLAKVGRIALFLVTLAVVGGCGASTATERTGVGTDDEKLGKVDDVNDTGESNEKGDSIEWVVIDTTNKGDTGSAVDTPWSFDNLSLDIYQKEIPDTSEHASFRFHVRNSSDSLAVIDRVEPSCGCIMATVQKSFVVKGREGEIYVGLVVSRMSDIQPYTIDVYTTLNPDKPLRMTIRKVDVTDDNGQ